MESVGYRKMFENRTNNPSNRKRIRLGNNLNYVILNFQENNEYIGDFENIVEGNGTTINKEEIFDIIEEKVIYAIEHPISHIEKANYYLSKVTCISQASKNFTLPTYENVTWSLENQQDERVELVDK